MKGILMITITMI